MTGIVRPFWSCWLARREVLNFLIRSDDKEHNQELRCLHRLVVIFMINLATRLLTKDLRKSRPLFRNLQMKPYSFMDHSLVVAKGLV